MSTQTSTSTKTQTYVKTLVAVAIGAAALAAAAGVTKLAINEKGRDIRVCLEETQLKADSNGGLKNPRLEASNSVNCISLLDVTFSDVSIQATDKTATISWRTNIPVAGRLSMSAPGIPGEFRNVFAYNYPNEQTDHRVDINYLSPNTTYRFALFAQLPPPHSDRFGAAAQLEHEKFQFTTTPPIVSHRGIGVSIGETSATISWNTDQTVLGKIYYRSINAPQQHSNTIALDASPTSQHMARLENLFPGATYEFTLFAFDPSTGRDSEGYKSTFTTKSSQPSPASPPAPAGRGGRGGGGRGSGGLIYQ